MIALSKAATVSELWRFPVKSMGGEALQSADVDARGVVGDRLWALRDETSGTITGGKKLPRLMQCTARYLEEPDGKPADGTPPPVAIRLPDGAELRSDRGEVDAGLSAFLGHNVTLCARRPASDRAHYRAQKTTAADLRRTFGVGPGEPLPDLSMFPLSMLAKLARFSTPPGSYFDAYPLHILSTGSLAALRAAAPEVEFPVSRFRPNVVLQLGEDTSAGERAWCGGEVSVGSIVIRIEIPTVRCSMIMRAQQGLDEDSRVLRTAVAAGRCVGVYGSVKKSGRVQVGQEIEVDVPEPSRIGSWMKSVGTSIRRTLLRAALSKR